MSEDRRAAARDHLAAAAAADDPVEALALALEAAHRLLQVEADAPSAAFADVVVVGSTLDKREAAQLIRLNLVRQRAAEGEPVDPLDAAQAVRLVRILAERILDRKASGDSGVWSDAPGAIGDLAAPNGRVEGAVNAAGPTPPSVLEPTWPDTPSEPAPAVNEAQRAYAPMSAAPTGDWLRRQAAPATRRAPVWHVVWFAINLALTLVVLAVGPLVLALLGPPYVRWLAWPVGLWIAWQAARHLQAVALRYGAVQAVALALVVGPVMGAAWAAAAFQGWMPPIEYVLRTPLPSVSVIRAPRAAAKLTVGSRARVEGTLATGLRVRVQPGLNAAEVARLPDGTLVELLSGPQSADGFVWWQVKGAGVQGWVADEWLTPLD